MSIRSRLILLVLSVLAPALLAALWVIATTYANERSVIEHNLRDTTRALSMVVDRELARRDSIARVLALSPAIDGDLAQFRELARRASDGIEGKVVLSSAQRVLVDTGLPAGGRPEAPPQAPAPALLTVPTTTPMQPDPGTNTPRAALVRPVERDGKTAFNVAVTVLPRELQRIVDEQRLPAGWSSAIIDSGGTVVAHQPSGDHWRGRPITDELRARRMQGSEGFYVTESLQGVPTVAFFSSSDSNWSYVIAVPSAQLGSSIRRSLIPLLAGIAVLVSVAVLGAIWVSRAISGPVEALSAATRELQLGKPVQRRTTHIAEIDQVNTALVDASHTLLRVNDELERQVAQAVQHTRQTEQRASHGQRVEALGRLTGGVAHDFNNLLGVISNSAHLMRRLPPGDGQDAAAATLQRAVGSGSRLTQHLLRVAGRQPVKPQRVDLHSYLPHTSELVESVMGSAIAVETDVAPSTRAITVDSSELELALINLALNARDAMAGGGRLRLVARNARAGEFAVPGSGAQVVISVSDTGHGVEEALLNRVFEPFFTTKPMGKGSGLGLSQVHGFCRQAGGAVFIHSRPGAGTTVSLLLPADGGESATPVDASIDSSGAQGTVARKSAGAQSAASAIHVLLVEDNADLGDVTEGLLRSFGYRVSRAADAEQALGVLETETHDAPVDVVLSDVVMPGNLDGIGLARRLRERLPPLPVVLISGFNAARELREFEVLQKPCPPAVLHAALQRALGRAIPA